MLSTVCHKYTKLHGRFCDALPRAGELSVKLVAIEIFETEMNYKYIGKISMTYFEKIKVVVTCHEKN
ncbi:Uncharacterised protein [Proteus mirabilis]|uniref:Uncharacterized protein n=1 Tax=Proteus mirabilis TaxID=584 RepID=A0A379GBS4_PROMI|nr:Uncharacterised protein [Proteus mirabilis]